MHTIVYANGDHDREGLGWPLRADRWLWAAGRVWCAVIADWHTDWWEGGDPETFAERPSVCSLPIHQIPPTGTLSYVDVDGNSVEHPTPRRRRRPGTVAHAFAPTADGGCAEVSAEHDPSVQASQLKLTGRGREQSPEIEERLRAAFVNSGYSLPAGQTTVRIRGVRSLTPGLDLAIACAVLAANGQLVAERLATHALHGAMLADGSLRCGGPLQPFSQAAKNAGASALLLPDYRPTFGPPLHTVVSLRDAIATLERGPLPTVCPACTRLPELLGGEELLELRRGAPDDAPADGACLDDEPGWRCANVNCTQFGCYLPAPPPGLEH
jgi:hypothetical protein